MTTTTNGVLIRALRTGAGMTTRELGAVAHVDGSTISRAERGRYESTSWLTLERIGKHFGVPAWVLYVPTERGSAD